MFQGPSVKPACLSGIVLGLENLALLCNGRNADKSSFGIDASGAFVARALLCYPPPLCKAIAGCVMQSLDCMFGSDSGPTGSHRAGDPCAATLVLEYASARAAQ